MPEVVESRLLDASAPQRALPGKRNAAICITGSSYKPPYSLIRRLAQERRCPIAADGIFPFVLSGQTIDRKLNDNLNSYTCESGSDGVVRIAAANLRGRFIELEQQAPRRKAATSWNTESSYSYTNRSPPRSRKRKYWRQKTVCCSPIRISSAIGIRWSSFAYMMITDTRSGFRPLADGRRGQLPEQVDAGYLQGPAISWRGMLHPSRSKPRSAHQRPSAYRARACDRIPDSTPNPPMYRLPCAYGSSRACARRCGPGP